MRPLGRETECLAMILRTHSWERPTCAPTSRSVSPASYRDRVCSSIGVNMVFLLLSVGNTPIQPKDFKIVVVIGKEAR